MDSDYMRRLFAILTLIFPFAVNACPFCNIHNYMASSIRASEAIVLGVLVKNGGEDARLHVLEVLRGNYEVGEELDWELHYYKAGDTAVFCKAAPDEHPYLFFQYYDRSAVGEIRFLLSGDSLARDLNEARTCLLGISADAVSTGIHYFEAHPEELNQTFPGLLDSLLRLPCRGISNQMVDWRYASLCEAVMKATPSTAEALFFSVLNAQPPCLRLENDYALRYAPQGEPAYFYSHLLVHSKEQKDLNAKLKAFFLNRLRAASGAELSNLVFALVSSDSITETEWAQLHALEEKDAVAYGCLRASMQSANYWSWELASKQLDEAIACEPEDKALKRMLREQERFVQLSRLR